MFVEEEEIWHYIATDISDGSCFKSLLPLLRSALITCGHSARESRNEQGI